jgi:hypothetical protein
MSTARIGAKQYGKVQPVSSRDVRNIKRFNASNACRRLDEVQDVENCAGRSECDTERRELPRGQATTMIELAIARRIFCHTVFHGFGLEPFHGVGLERLSRAAHIIQRDDRLGSCGHALRAAIFKSFGFFKLF